MHWSARSAQPRLLREEPIQRLTGRGSRRRQADRSVPGTRRRDGRGPVLPGAAPESGWAWNRIEPRDGLPALPEESLTTRWATATRAATRPGRRPRVAGPRAGRP